MNADEHRALAAKLADEARDTASKSAIRAGGVPLTQAGVKATLALYHQREADRLEGAQQ
jgi:hypothetical protein